MPVALDPIEKHRGIEGEDDHLRAGNEISVHLGGAFVDKTSVKGIIHRFLPAGKAVNATEALFLQRHGITAAEKPQPHDEDSGIPM